MIVGAHPSSSSSNHHHHHYHPFHHHHHCHHQQWWSIVTITTTIIIIIYRHRLGAIWPAVPPWERWRKPRPRARTHPPQAGLSIRLYLSILYLSLYLFCCLKQIFRPLKCWHKAKIVNDDYADFLSDTHLKFVHLMTFLNDRRSATEGLIASRLGKTSSSTTTSSNSTSPRKAGHKQTCHIFARNKVNIVLSDWSSTNWLLNVVETSVFFSSGTPSFRRKSRWRSRSSTSWSRRRACRWPWLVRPRGWGHVWRAGPTAGHPGGGGEARAGGEEEQVDRGGGEQQEAAEGDRGQDPEGVVQLAGQHLGGRDRDPDPLLLQDPLWGDRRQAKGLNGL